MLAHSALRMYFDRRKKSAPGFSVRSLARRLDISPSFLSRALNGKRPIPHSLQVRLAEALNVEPELLAGSAAVPSKTKEVGVAVGDWAIAGTETLEILRSWHFLPILELTTLADYDGSATQISERLGLASHVTDMALRELEGLGLLKRVAGKFSKTEEKIRFTSSKPNPNIKKFHDEMLEKAQQQLRSSCAEGDFQRRLITGITLSASPRKVQEAKRKLADCLYEIANDLAAEPGTDVYHLSAQLFPLTRI